MVHEVGLQIEFIGNMERENQTSLKEFIFLGLSDDPKLQTLLFATGLLIYMLTLAGNLAIIRLVQVDQHLHTPMYFLLSNLSFTEICYITTTMPKMLWDLLSKKKTISFAGCMLQMYFFLTTAATEGVLLSVMAYDRYAAICRPLHYTLLMSQPVCRWLLAASWAIGNINAMVNTTFVFSLNFCGSNQIVHFFCDIPPVLHLSCSDTSLAELVTFIVSGSIMTITVSLIVLSYILIVSSVLKIHTVQGRIKTFSTCASHLTVVSIFYSTAIFTYMRPSSSHSMEQDRLISVLYTIITPLLNPLIYSFKNKDMQAALRNVLRKKGCR
ncbi:olfactory receptor 5F1-like [Hemicordylus capensis]|uniref:olfactory receptor 5F1-like n=1 Tax=Hemicordylus capensis TaxID=884348 RepID=UPI002302B624|nr:olfactory receptor 5F1-like [Hemicordylus capensis]